jgi:RNA polymerase sigma-70 factor (ECF subfamily)
VTPAPAPPRNPVPIALEALRRGEPEALAAIYRLHAGSLLRTLVGFLGDASEAEDVLHDLFAGLPEALRRYEERGTLGAWLRRVALRIALQRVRSARRRREVSIGGLEPLGRRDASEALPARLLVEQALAALPEGLRTVVVLRELEGWSHREIAAFLGLREGAVMTRHCRAMKRLRVALEDER